MANILAINIPSFAGGCDVWGNTNKIGIKKFKDHFPVEKDKSLKPVFRK